jgi:transcriptional regulator with XRE-family HTH domain
METLGQRIKRMREERHWSQEVLADYLGVSARAVGNWENDKNQPRSRLGALEKVFKESLEDRSGDPVEAAIRATELTEWRQDAVLSFYKRNLYEQREEQAS